MQSSIAISIVLPSFSCSLWQFIISHSFHLTCPCQPTPHQFLLKTVFHSNLHSQFINYPLINSQLSRFFLPSCFREPKSAPGVSLLVSSYIAAFINAGVTHELSTFRERLSPIIPSTFLQVYTPAVFLIITKANYLVHFALGN